MHTNLSPTTIKARFLGLPLRRGLSTWNGVERRRVPRVDPTEQWSWRPDPEPVVFGKRKAAPAQPLKTPAGHVRLFSFL